jgi:O-antigen ligase
MPLVWLLAIRSRAGIFVKAFVGAVLLVMITAILRSGSREGLVGLAILGVLCFLHSSMAGKVGLAVAAVALAVGAAVLMPGSLKSRFATTFQGGPTEMEEYRGVLEREVMLSAAASTQIRSEMLMSSLKLTIQHPLLGIGPGDFAAYLADEAKSRNALAYWVGAHNTYTQLSSEAGIPALCLYLGTLISSLRALSRVSRRGRRIPDDRARDICTAAQALSASFVVYCVCGLFNHMAYEPTMPLMAGIALAISRAAPEELGRLEAAIAGQRGVRISLAAVSPVPTGPSRKRLAMRKRYGGAREELAAGPAWRIHGSE